MQLGALYHISKNKQLNVEQLGNGVYIVSVEADQQQYTKKLIIKK